VRRENSRLYMCVEGKFPTVGSGIQDNVRQNKYKWNIILIQCFRTRTASIVFFLIGSHPNLIIFYIRVYILHNDFFLTNNEARKKQTTQHIFMKKN